MKSTVKLMFAALFAAVAPFGITEDSAAGAVAAAADPTVAATAEPTAAPVSSLTSKINQFFASADKRHLQEALLMMATEIDALHALLATSVVAQEVDARLVKLEDFIGVNK